jgi:hypothetical protein
MSVFHKLYLGSEWDYNQFKEWVIERVADKNMKITDTSNEFIVSSVGFTIFIKEGGNSVTFRSEDYRLNFRFDLYIDINSSYSNWAVELMEFAGEILKDIDGDFVLEANGDTAYLMRNKANGEVIVDDSNLGCFPFEHLGVEYKKEVIEQV